MAWWDDLWLNEAFASLMEGEALEALRPDWEPWNQIQLDTEDVLVTDSLSASHPIHVPVASAEEANALFDDITYSKGSAALHMLELYLTPEKWRAGVHAYLTAHALGNATEADLWQALSAATGKDVGAIAASWFDQPGYPLIVVSGGVGRAAGKVTLAQQPILVAPAPVPAGVAPAPVPANVAPAPVPPNVGPTPVPAPPARLWQVPVCLDSPLLQHTESDCTLLTTATGSIDVPGNLPWVDANASFGGFYRVHYDRPDWGGLEAAFERGKGKGPNGPERMALLSDADWLSKVDLGNSPEPIDLLLELVSRMSTERDYAVWLTALSALTELDDNLLLEDDQPAFRAFVARELRPAAKELGWTAAKKDTPSRRSLRAAVLWGLAVLARDPKTITQAKAKLTEFEKKPASLDLTLLPLILLAAARGGDAALWDRFRTRMDSAQDLELRDRYRTALAEFGDPALIQKTLDLTLTGGIRKQDIPSELGTLLGNPLARAETRVFLERHWGELKDRFSGIAATWSILPALGDFCSEADHDELATFFADPSHHVDGGDRAMKLALERIDLCVGFKKAQAAELSRRVGAHAGKR